MTPQKINNQGDLLWEHCFGGTAKEQIWFGFHYINKNNFVIAGTINYGPSYDVGCATYGGGINKDIWVFEVKDTTANVQYHEPLLAGLTTYPNPATTELWLQLPENPSPAQAQIELISPTGKLLYKAQPTSQFHKIDLAHLPAGLYLVRLWDGERWATEKVVVE